MVLTEILRKEIPNRSTLHVCFTYHDMTYLSCTHFFRMNRLRALIQSVLCLTLLTSAKEQLYLQKEKYIEMPQIIIYHWYTKCDLNLCDIFQIIILLGELKGQIYIFFLYYNTIRLLKYTKIDFDNYIC